MGDLDEDVFMQLPPCVSSSNPNHVCRLSSALVFKRHSQIII